MPLVLALEAYMKEAFGYTLEVTQYGKPERKTFEYAKALLLAQAAALNVEIDNFFMIGDNPRGGIAGATRMGWQSILVRTGVYQGEPLSPEHQPTHLVADMKQAFDLILQDYIPKI